MSNQIKLPEPDGYAWHEGRMAPDGSYEAGFGFTTDCPEEAENQLFAKEIWRLYGIDTVRSLIAEAEERATAEANRRANASWSRMAEQMVAAEREACAELCVQLHNHGADDLTASPTNKCAAAIRARGPEKCCAGGPQWGHAWHCKKLP